MSRFEYKTEQFVATLGINAGYAHDNRISIDEAVGAFVRLWREAADEAEKEFGVLVTVRVHSGKVVYPIEKGCPEKGEDILILQGTRNPYHTPDSDKWREAVIFSVEQLKARTGQVTAQVIFQSVDLMYLKSE